MASTKQNSAGNISKKTVRVPLVGNSQQRSVLLDKDQRFINCLIETTTNTVTNTKKLFLVKRPGTVLYDDVTTASEARGVWYFNTKVYSVFGNTLYKDGVSFQTLSTLTGMCGATEFVNVDDFGNAGLFLADGIDAWVIDSSHAITRVDNKHLAWEASTLVEVGDRRVPTILDTYWYVCTASGRTGATEPTWSTSNTDGTATWARGGSYTGPAKYTTSTAYLVDDEVTPTTITGYWYKVTTAGTTDVTEPTDWPLTVGLTVTNGTVVFECAGEYGGFPTPHVPTPVYMDGYIALPDSGSQDVYNCNITKPFSWGALSFTSAESYPDNIVGLARQNNYLAAFGTESTEFLYNSAKANALEDFDSPFTSHETMVIQTGSISRTAILQSEKTIMFVASARIGGHSVWRIDGTQAKEISTEYIEKFLDRETTIDGFGIRINGHMLFVINLATSNRTFVYDLEEGLWTEWQYDGGVFPFNNFCDANGTFILQHKTNGKLYEIDPEVFSDFDADITVEVVLAKQDFETDSFKFFTQTTIIGDSTAAPVNLSWSDDDYTTWSSDKPLTLGVRPYFMRSGCARRRAWRLEYTDNSRLRLEALEVTYTVGDH